MAWVLWDKCLWRNIHGGILDFLKNKHHPSKKTYYLQLNSIASGWELTGKGYEDILINVFGVVYTVVSTCNCGFNYNLFCFSFFGGTSGLTSVRLREP